MIFKILPRTCDICGQYILEPDGTFICTGTHSSNYGGVCAQTAAYLKTKHVAVMRDRPANVTRLRIAKESIPTGKSVCTDKNNLREPLRELIEMSESYPHPCYFLNTPVKAWFAKINEEVFEAHEAILFGDKNKVAEEVTDIITVCTSFLEFLGIDKKNRMEIQRRVNEKNRRRGYWREEK